MLLRTNIFANDFFYKIENNFLTNTSELCSLRMDIVNARRSAHALAWGWTTNDTALREKTYALQRVKSPFSPFACSPRENIRLFCARRLRCARQPAFVRLSDVCSISFCRISCALRCTYSTPKRLKKVGRHIQYSSTKAVQRGDSQI